MVTLDQTSLLGRQRELITLLINRVDAGEQSRIEQDAIQVGGELRRHLALHRIQSRVGMRGHQAEKDPGCAIQNPPRALQGDQGVVEIRCRGLPHDGFDLGQLRGHSGLECRQEMLITDAVKGRVLIVQRAVDEQWIGIRLGRLAWPQGTGTDKRTCRAEHHDRFQSHHRVKACRRRTRGQSKIEIYTNVC